MFDLRDIEENTTTGSQSGSGQAATASSPEETKPQQSAPFGGFSRTKLPEAIGISIPALLGTMASDPVPLPYRDTVQRC